jgi:hypothetical protein
VTSSPSNGGARVPSAEALRGHLLGLKALRGASAVPPPRLTELKRWQSARLKRTYADVSSQARYRAATSFFIEDLYGPKDFSARDEEMLRIVPVMARILPKSAVETAALAIELEALSEDLDQRLVKALGLAALDDASYGRAYRESSSPEERRHQVGLIGAVGRRLDLLVKKPLVAKTLRLMRGPAQVAGLGDLQEFLEKGFESFGAMQGADEFLALIASREERILSRLFSSAPEPFSI